MPIATNGIYELRLRTSILGEDLFNVFHFLATTGLDTHAQDLADTWKLAKTPFIQALLGDAVQFEDILCFPVFGTGIEVIVPYTAGETGDRPGEILASFVSCSFKYNRSTRETRSGWKRFGPMAEENTFGNIFTAGYVTLMDQAAAALEGAVVGAESDYIPVIFRPANSAADPTARYNQISSVSSVNRVTTQSSRKSFD